MAARTGRLTPAASAVGAALALVLVGSGAAWAVGVHDAGRADQQQQAAAGVVLTRFEARVGGLVRSLDLDPRTSPPMSAAVTQIDRVNVSGAVEPLWPIGARTPVHTVDAAIRTAMDLAGDSGEPRAAAPSAGGVVVAVAEFPAGNDKLPTLQRRTSVTGWRLAALVPDRILDDLPLPKGSTARLVLADEAIDTEASTTVLVAGQPWQLALDLPEPSKASFGSIGVLAMTLLGATLLLAFGVRSRRVISSVRQATLALERETRTVAELGPLLQSSLDLAEVLPAVSLRLSDEFGLSRFAIQLMGEHGHFVDVFAIGSRSGSAHQEVPLTAATAVLPSGTPASLPLLRAGRTIGRLSLTARRPLHQTQIAALSAAADLIAVATYNVELYEREQASVRRLRDLDQLKDAFLGTISHELRTPITAIGGFVRLMRERWTQISDEQRLEFLERVHRNSVSLGLLVDDLLDFARLERQALNAPASPVQLDETVTAIVSQLAPVLGDRHVEVDLVPVRALANVGALERVLANLLTNANKFSPVGSPIAVRVSAQGTTATVEVVDEGPGIAAEDRDHIFTRFYRGESNAALSTRGAGIGLSVVRELVAQMGGSVAALPNTPQGTRMVVTLAQEPATASVTELPFQDRRKGPSDPAVIRRSGT